VKPLAFFLFAAAPIYAGVNYYLTDNLHAIDPTKWTTVGSLAPSATGLAASSPNGGALISKVPVPDGTAEAEVLATLTLEHSGGVYTEYLQASPNSHTGPQGGGAYLAFEMQNPTFDSTGHCVANFLVFQSSPSGAVSLLSSFQHACRNGMIMRFAVHGTTALVWPDQAQPVEFSVRAAIGSPGIGSYNAPAGNAISLVQLGAIARELPPAIDQHTIGISTFRSHVDVQWKPTAVSATSAGLNSYFIYRDGDYLMRTANTNFSDEAVAPGATHSYTIYVVDQHFNLSTGTSITVSTPAIASVKK
jgi:hypothetical protein